MYNGFVKAFFLRKCSLLSKEVYKQFFTITESYEREAGKDISDFTYAEVKELINKIPISSENMLQLFCNSMSEYAIDLQESSMSKMGINSFKLVTQEDIKESIKPFKTKNKELFTLEELQRFCKFNIPNPCDRVLIYCFFYGVFGKAGEEIGSITKDSILENGKLKLSTGREVFVPDFLIDEIRKSCDIYEYISNSLNVTRGQRLIQTDNTVFKTRGNTKINNIERRIKDRMERLRNEITFEEGCKPFYIKKIRDAGIMFHSFVCDVENIKQQYNITDTFIDNIKRKYKDY